MESKTSNADLAASYFIAFVPRNHRHDRQTSPMPKGASQEDERQRKTSRKDRRAVACSGINKK
jgi:hypothetical protein